jgi:hypothetical protein
MSQFRWLFAVAGAVLGVMALTLVHNVKAQIQPPRGQILPPRVVSKTCNVSPTFGAFKGVWEEWLVFEDAAGTLRSVDDSCEVRQTIRRQ